MRVDDTVRRATTLVVTILVGVVTLTVLSLFVPGLREVVFPGPAATDAYVVGEVVDVPAAFFDRADRTLLVFARSSCGGCQRAKPLMLKSVGRIRQEPDAAVRLVATGRDQIEEQRYGRELGLTPEEVLPAPDGLRLQSVPTLVVVDREGRILLRREGVVYSEAAEKEILNSLEGVIAAR